MADPADRDEVAGRLLESARRLLDERGLDAVTVRSVAAGADMSTMNVYSRFGGKDGLLDVLYREGFARLRADLEAVDEATIAEQMRATSDAYRAFARTHPARYRLMFGGDLHGFRPSDDAAAEARGLFAVIVDRIERAVDDGQMTMPDGSSAALIASALWAIAHGVVAFEQVGMAGSVVDWANVHTVGVDALVTQLAGAGRGVT